MYVEIMKQSISVTYSHIKHTAGIRDGMNIHLRVLTTAGDVEPETVRLCVRGT